MLNKRFFTALDAQKVLRMSQDEVDKKKNPNVDKFVKFPSFREVTITTTTTVNGITTTSVEDYYQMVVKLKDNVRLSKNKVEGNTNKRDQYQQLKNDIKNSKNKV